MFLNSSAHHIEKNNVHYFLWSSHNLRFHLPLTQSGFGNIDGEYWLGLQGIYKLGRQADYKLLVELEDWMGKKVYAQYSSFHLEPESEGYRLRLGTYQGNAGDSLSSHNGKPFTTLDRDKDAFSGRWTYLPLCSGIFFLVYFDMNIFAMFYCRNHWCTFTPYKATHETIWWLSLKYSHTKAHKYQNRQMTTSTPPKLG